MEVVKLAFPTVRLHSVLYVVPLQIQYTRVIGDTVCLCLCVGVLVRIASSRAVCLFENMFNEHIYHRVSL